jgi:oligopeptide/dipeptide ABC transporter ATP-binding protein
VPSVEARGQRLKQIPGVMALPLDLQGCAFAPRCERARAECAQDLPLLTQQDGRRLRCCNPA